MNVMKIMIHSRKTCINVVYISFKCLEDEDACIFYIKIIKKVKTMIGINNDIYKK